MIGLDQFEEILDDLGAIDLRPYAANWKPLLSFVEMAAKSGYFGFIYTLESSRKKVFDSIELPDVFRTAYEVRIGGYDDGFLEEIITKPFAKAYYRLESRIVNELLASYKDYSEKIEGHASMLPLFSLKLSNLFETVKSLKNVRIGKPSRGGMYKPSEDQWVEITWEEVKDELHFDNEIEDLANMAWGTNNKPEDEQLDDLNFFLQPLVALSGEDLDKITLQTVGEAPVVNLDERLLAFEKVRLVIRENGRRKLVHEAVIRQWFLATKWLKHKREYLVDEAAFRTAANVWHNKGKPPALTPKDEASIDMAAAVLHSYLYEWIFCDQADLTSGDQKFMNYCLTIFRQSKTPKRSDSHYGSNAHSHIHLAASYGMIELIERFLKSDPDVLEFKTYKGRTAIDQAAWSNLETTRCLIDKGANPINFDKDGWSTITAALWRNDSDIFKLLSSYYCTVESIKAPSGMNLLHIAAWRGAINMATILLNMVEGIDPMQEDDQGRTPLDFAAMHNQPEAFKFFLKYCDVRHQPGQHGYTVLHYAATNGALSIVNEILNLPQFHDLVDSPNNAGETALMLAAKQRQDAVVCRLLEVMDPNEQVQKNTGKKGWTALHYAINGPDDQKRETGTSRQQALRTVRALLAEPNIDPTLKTSNGMAPIMLAKSPHVRRELISHSSFAWNKRFSDGTTPLNSFIKDKDRPAVERMLRMTDIDVEFLSSNGEYALSLLIENDMADLALRIFEERHVDPWNLTGVKDIGLSAAIFADHEPLITAYLEKLPEVLDQPHRRFLSLGARTAIIVGKSGVFLERLIELGAAPELRLTENGWTLFHYAALIGNIEVFDQFAQKSGATSRRDVWGRRPADLAPASVHAQFKARMTDMEDEPPLDSGAGAIRKFLNKIILKFQSLLTSTLRSKRPLDADVYKIGSSEMLFARARLGDIEGIKELLANQDIDPMIRDEWGRSPADHAPDSRREEIADLLHRAASGHYN